MRFLRFGAGLLVVATLFVTVSSSRADLITVTVTDGTTTYTGSSSTGDATIPNFTLDGVTFRGVDAFEIFGPDSLNFQAGLSGKESSGKTITYTVTDVTFSASLPATGFYTSTGLSAGVKSGTLTAGSTVDSVAGPSVTIPFSSTAASSINSTNTSIPSSSSLTVTLTGTITGFQMKSSPPTFSAATNFTVPEPTGVLMGLLGLPCLGAVVFFSRRRSLAALAA
jgi:hypothetical protein